MTIDFKDLERSTVLLRDYLGNTGSIRSFFPVHANDPAGLRSLLPKAATRAHRDTLTETLLRQNRSFDNDPAAIANVEKLRDPKTLAVVTGQQMGLFTGPLYTIYKALATVRWCQYFHDQFPEYTFVPVFWLELEDHDFREVGTIRLIDATNDLISVTYEGGDQENKSKTPICRLILTDEIAQRIGEISAALNKTDFTESWLKDVQAAYRPGETLSNAFAKLMARWLGRYGLILMDPSDPELKKLAAPIFKKALTDAAPAHERFVKTTSDLKQAGYSAQVETEPAYLFVSDPSHDLPWNSKATDKVRITSEELTTHRDEILSIPEKEPQRFIPNVVLRPIVQDFLLPTMAYVAGPGEIAYFAQFRSLYEFFGVPEPAIVPRPFLTLLEKKIKKVPEKYGLSVKSILNEGESLVEKVAAQTSSVSNGPELERMIAEFSGRLAPLEKSLVQTDPSLKGAVATASDKIRQALTVLQTKTLEAEKRNHELVHTQLVKAIRHLLPNGQFQERELNALYYLNKYGYGLFDTILANADPAQTGHRVVEL